MDYVGVDVRTKFDDSRLNIDRIIRLFGRQHPFYSLLRSILLPRFAAEQKQPVMFVRPIIPDKCIKLGDSCLNRSREIPPAAVVVGHVCRRDIMHTIRQEYESLNRNDSY